MNCEFVTTSDGRIAFRRDEFRLMDTGNPNVFQKDWTITIWTTSYPTGRIVHYPTLPDRDRTAKEIAAQLATPTTSPDKEQKETA